MQGGKVMKKIEVIINRGKVDSLYTALARTECPGLVVHEMDCVNRIISSEQELRKRKGRSSLASKAKIEILSGDDDIDRLVDAICTSGAVSGTGDDRIYVCTAETPTL
jgi:nitrogen regulatory protein P-II 1